MAAASIPTPFATSLQGKRAIRKQPEEGRSSYLLLTGDGTLGPLKPGTEKILERTPVRVIPVRLDGLWGSYFSRKANQAFRKPFRRLWSRISLAIHPPLKPEQATLKTLEGTLSTPTTP